MQIENIPVLGGTAPRHALRTAHKLASFALRYVDSIRSRAEVRRYLDVGCGNGFITELIAPTFDEIVGIDVEHLRLEEFRLQAILKSNFKILLMSADKVDFPNEFFSFITSFEVLEHVPSLGTAVQEMIRLCRPGGIIVVSTPQVWFPFENHGARIGNRTYFFKIPLLPWIRPLHRKYSLARVFSSAELDRLFLSQEMELLGTSYAAPQFERAAARDGSWESRLVFLRGVLDRCENIHVLRALTGVSMLKAYRKRPSACGSDDRSTSHSCSPPISEPSRKMAGLLSVAWR
ncbi:MAG: class I SAM-dependent methyltransferase [Candidatus Acidiferrales bacterium]